MSPRLVWSRTCILEKGEMGIASIGLAECGETKRRMEKAQASSHPPSVNARCLVPVASEVYHHVVKQCG